MERYIVYQPMHGMAVELHILETVMRIAKILDRKFVIPLLPRLETLEYGEGLDDYFQIPHNTQWISTKNFMRDITHDIDVLYHVVPHYRSEYENILVRKLHPVWLDLIENNVYFSKLNYNIKKSVNKNIYTQLNEEDILKTFDSKLRTIAISYVNGILENEYVNEGNKSTEFDALQMSPRSPVKKYMDIAKEIMPYDDYMSIHWRRGQHAKEMSEISNITLPSITSYYDLMPRGFNKLYIASDMKEVGFESPFDSLFVGRFFSKDPIDNAIIDICCCINSNHFIGNDFSTFSHYISYSRKRLGKSFRSSVLIK